MSLIPALLQAIVRIDGEALVMHAGDKPYVVSPTEQVDLASRGLTLEAVNGVVAQLLPAELAHALDEFGAVQHELAPMAEFPGEHFTVVAARGGDDVWVEIRRRRIPEEDRVPDEFFAPAAPETAEAVASVQASAPDAVSDPPSVEYDADELPAEVLGFDTPVVDAHAHASAQGSETRGFGDATTSDDDLQLPDEAHLWPGRGASVVNIREGAKFSAQDDTDEFEIDLDSDDGAEGPEPSQPIPIRPAAQTQSSPISLVGSPLPEAAGGSRHTPVAPPLDVSVGAASNVDALAPWAELSLDEEHETTGASPLAASAQAASLETPHLIASASATPDVELIGALDEVSTDLSERASTEAASELDASGSWAEMSLEASTMPTMPVVPESEPAAAWFEMSLDTRHAESSGDGIARAEVESSEAGPSVAAWLGGLMEASHSAEPESARDEAQAVVVEQAKNEAAQAAAAEDARREAERREAEQREAERREAEQREAERREAERREAERRAAEEAARVAAAEDAAREATCIAAAEEAEREAARIAAIADTEREAARLAAAEEAQREAERVAAEERAREAARAAAAEEAEREAARAKAAEEARRETERVAAEDAARESARIAAEQQAAHEAARLLAAEGAAREAVRIAAVEREAARIAATAEAEREAARRFAAEEAQREADRAEAEESAREAARAAAAAEAEREAARAKAAEDARRETERLAAEEATREAARAAAEESAIEVARLAAAARAEQEAALIAAAEASSREAARAAAEEEAERKAKELAEETARQAEHAAAAERAREAARLAAAEEAEREAARARAAEEASREAERLAAQDEARETARAAAQEAAIEAARAAAAQKAVQEAALMAAAEASAREAARVAAEQEREREAQRAAAVAAAIDAVKVAAAEDSRREVERVAADAAMLEVARVAAAEEAARGAARLAAVEEAARQAAAREAEREAERVAAAERAAQEAARLAAEAARREASQLAAEEAALAAARAAVVEETEREAARIAIVEEAAREAERRAIADEARREAERVAAATAALEAALVTATEDARREAQRLVAEVTAREAARMAAVEEAERQAALSAAAEEARREAERVKAEEAALEASRVAAAAEAEREAARIAMIEEAVREAARAAAVAAARHAAERAAAEEAAREAARIAAEEQARRDAERLSTEEASREAPRVAASGPIVELELVNPHPDIAATPSFERWSLAASVAPAGGMEPVTFAFEAADETAAIPSLAGTVTASASAPSTAEMTTEAPVASVEHPVEPAPGMPAETATAPESAPEVAAASAVRPVPGQPAVVLNIARNPIRSETPAPAVEDPMLSGLERLLRVSSARGASTLYLSSGSRPSVRVDGELQMLDGEPVHASRDVESLLLTLMPARSHEALRTGAATEWISHLEGVGRVRCMSFRDQRGPGGVFRLMPTRSVSAEEVGLPKQMQSLALEPEGLVLIAGTRSSGKRTTMAAFVDLMNRTRRDHIITIEREITIQHERGNSFISQREVRGNDEDLLAAMRAALREDPDVLVVEELRTGALMNLALEGAAAGRLVVGGFTAHTATGAIDRIIDMYAPEQQRQVQMALAHAMRGVIAQVLLRKIGGGRLPAREVLLNTPAVSSAIAEGKTSQLPMAIEGGRGHGMMPLNDALVGLVRNGSVEVRDAYRHSPDRPGFLGALNRQGIDTSFAEHLANG